VLCLCDDLLGIGSLKAGGFQLSVGGGGA
jgi:hypothetical protein